MRASEKLVAALDLLLAEQSKSPGEARDPLLIALGNLSASDYLAQTLEAVPSSELENAILVLPLAYVLRLLPELRDWLQADRSVERACRTLFFLLRAHYHQLAGCMAAAAVLQELRSSAQMRLTNLKDVLGFNRYIYRPISFL